MDCVIDALFERFEEYLCAQGFVPRAGPHGFRKDVTPLISTPGGLRT